MLEHPENMDEKSLTSVVSNSETSKEVNALQSSNILDIS